MDYFFSWNVRDGFMNGIPVVLHHHVSPSSMWRTRSCVSRMLSSVWSAERLLQCPVMLCSPLESAVPFLLCQEPSFSSAVHLPPPLFNTTGPKTDCRPSVLMQEALLSGQLARQPLKFILSFILSFIFYLKKKKVCMCFCLHVWNLTLTWCNEMESSDVSVWGMRGGRSVFTLSG